MATNRTRFAPLAARASLADGCVHPRHVIHRRRHGVHRDDQILGIWYPSISRSALASWCWRSFVSLRLYYGAPALPADLPEPMKLAAKLSHYVFYALMIAMPLLGWAMLSAAEYPVVLYGGLHLPPLVSVNPELHTLLWDAHFYLAFVVLRVDPPASRGGALSQAGSARRRVRGHGAGCYA
jgi:hypothetical protein